MKNYRSTDVVVLFSCAYFCILITIIFIFTRNPGCFPDAKLSALKMSMPEVVTITLASLAVMVAIVTLFIGALAIWGYSQFERIVNERASLVANSIISASLEKDGQLGKLVTEGLQEGGALYATIMEAIQNEGKIYKAIIDSHQIHQAAADFALKEEEEEEEAF